jgi:hypothetical protein
LINCFFRVILLIPPVNSSSRRRKVQKHKAKQINDAFSAFGVKWLRLLMSIRNSRIVKIRFPLCHCSPSLQAVINWTTSFVDFYRSVVRFEPRQRFIDDLDFFKVELYRAGTLGERVDDVTVCEWQGEERISMLSYHCQTPPK